LGRVHSQTVVEHHTAGRVYRHFVYDKLTTNRMQYIFMSNRLLTVISKSVLLYIN